MCVVCLQSTNKVELVSRCRNPDLSKHRVDVTSDELAIWLDLMESSRSSWPSFDLAP